MAYISTDAWLRYIRRLDALNNAAAAQMRKWVQRNGFGDMDALIAYAYGLATKYGEGAAALAAEMYDAIAALQRAFVEPAEPAATADYPTVARTMQGIVDVSENVETVSAGVGRLVKQAGADTTLQNAARDGAQFAWVPMGDTCAFCITLASRGWQPASKKALKNAHAEHIHSNCNCTYAVRFRDDVDVRGYEPERYLAMYEGAGGGSSKDRINALRRQFYAENSERINVQKRSAYGKRRERESSRAEETEA